MSYANRKQMSSNRTAAIVVVALLHVVLGYALITGLAYNVIKSASEDLKTFDVEQPPPPPPPPPPEKQPDLPPPPEVAAPPPLVRTNIVQTPVIATPNPPPIIQAPVYRPAPPAPPAPPPPPRRVEPKSVVGDLQGLIQSSDYPQSAIDADEQGTLVVNLQIGTSGRVTGCSVSSSSGSRALDSTTCRILSSRAKFSPATDSSGNPIAGAKSQRITWRLQ